MFNYTNKYINEKWMINKLDEISDTIDLVTFIFMAIAMCCAPMMYFGLTYGIICGICLIVAIIGFVLSLIWNKIKSDFIIEFNKE